MSFIKTNEPYKFNENRSANHLDIHSDITSAPADTATTSPSLDLPAFHNTIHTKARPAACVFVASLVNGVPPQLHKPALEKLFRKWSTNPIDVKVLVDNRNRPYAFVQYSTEKEAKYAIKKAQGTLLHNRPIRCEHARVNRTIFLSPKSQDMTISSKELKAQLSAFGEIEEFLPASRARLLPNVNEFKDKEWFVRFAYREDAISAYIDASLKMNWDITWSQNIDSTLDYSKLDLRSISVENLDPKASDQLIKQRFEQYGMIRSFVVYRSKIKDESDPITWAIIKYCDEKSALIASEQQNKSTFLARTIHVRIRRMIPSFAVDDNVKTSDIRVPAASPPLIPVSQQLYTNRQAASSPNIGSFKRHSIKRNYSEQGPFYVSEYMRPRQFSTFQGYFPGGTYFGMPPPMGSTPSAPPPPLPPPPNLYHPAYDMNAMYQHNPQFGPGGGGSVSARYYTVSPQHPQGHNNSSTSNINTNTSNNNTNNNHNNHNSSQQQHANSTNKGPPMYMLNNEYQAAPFAAAYPNGLYPAVLGHYMEGYPMFDYTVPHHNQQHLHHHHNHQPHHHQPHQAYSSGGGGGGNSRGSTDHEHHPDGSKSRSKQALVVSSSSSSTQE